MQHEKDRNTALTSSHWDGNKYKKIALPQYEINNAFLNKHPFIGNEIVLDIGCGDGETTNEIATRIPLGKVKGIDASTSMIETARETHHLKNLSFALLNAQQINFSQEFDIITCFFCMQWIPEKLKTFKKIFSALRSGGHFLMIVPLPHPHLPVIRKKLITSEKWKKYFVSYEDPLIYINDSNYKFFAKEAGLSLSFFKIYSTSINFKDYDSFFNFMYEMTPHLSCLPNKQKKEAFLHELLNEYLEIFPVNTAGDYQLNFEFVKLHAERKL